MTMTRNITSWLTSMSLMWRIIVTTKLSASPVSQLQMFDFVIHV